MKDLYHDLLGEVSLKFAAMTSATDGQVVIDLQGYQGALIMVVSGTITDGTSYEFELKEGDEADGSDAAAVADSDLLGSEPSFAVDDDDKIKAFGYIGSKRYLRLDLKTVSGSPSTGGVFGAIVVKGFPRHAPVI